MNIFIMKYNKIIYLKYKSIISRLDRLKIETINSYQTKFATFFILSFILLIFFWYYIACFCAVYTNTQVHLLTDTLISFGTSLLTPFAIYLIAPLLRIPSLKSQNKTNEIIYNMSKTIALF